MLKISLVTLGVAALVVLSTPLAASAATAPSAYCGGGIDTGYANDRSVTVGSPVVSPGQTTTVTWSAGYFMPGASVTVTASGNSGSTPTVTVGSASGSGSATGSADGAGGLVASVAIPADAMGRVDIAAMSNAACGGVSVSIIPNTTPGGGVLDDNETVVSTTPTAVDSTNSATATKNNSATSTKSAAANLASTGGDLPTVLLVSGGAAVVFGAILIGARTRARRNMQE